MSLADIRPALRAFLLADSDINEWVGGSGGDDDGRLWPLVLKQGTTEPSIVYNTASSVGDHHMEGASGLSRDRIQIDSYAENEDDAFELAKAIQLVLDGASGDWAYGSDSPQSAVTVQGVFIRNKRDGYDDTAKMFFCSRDYEIAFAER